MTELILYTGPMFSSKTTKLLMEADKRQYQKQKIVSFKSRMDDRYSVFGEIVTHNFNKLPAHLVSTGDEIINKIVELEDLSDIDTVIIDELFLIAGGADACVKLFKKGYNVIIASIDLSFTGEPFEEVKNVMPYCTKIEKCTAVCSVCQKDARYTYKKNSVKHVESFESDDTLEQIQVGGSELYEARCQLHHNYMRD
jgi:thymidine kinase